MIPLMPELTIAQSNPRKTAISAADLRCRYISRCVRVLLDGVHSRTVSDIVHLGRPRSVRRRPDLRIPVSCRTVARAFGHHRNGVIYQSARD